MNSENALGSLTEGNLKLIHFGSTSSPVSAMSSAFRTWVPTHFHFAS
jgi:hypothetical protein